MAGSFGFNLDAEVPGFTKLGFEDFVSRVTDVMYSKYRAKESVIGPENIRHVERMISLQVIDSKWREHLLSMDELRDGIWTVGYGAKDPLVEYKMSAYEMFDAMSAGIQEDTVRLLFHVKVEQKVEREEVAKVTGTNKDESGPRAPKKRAEQKIYPNDPCPCGSGKKYKQCCGRKA